MLEAHHAIVVSPNLTPVASSGAADQLGVAPYDGYLGFGAEVGYLYFTDRARVASGFFLGPQFVVASASWTAQRGGASTHGSALGLAFDAGYQHVFAGGFTASGGVGLEYLVGSRGLLMAPVKQVQPRALLSLGYSF
jgi:hypothetical protein